jgi:predicted 3-demethylubiquinone-9 3-methyltransferase (glyoxalase superfamily)
MAILQKITPCLWFDTEAEEAAQFYVSVFEDSRILRVLHYTEAGYEIHGKPASTVLTVEFEISGERLTALNGGPQFKFSEAISLEVNCETQQEIDYYWDKLSNGGEKGYCGWLKDRYGLSWQVTPIILAEMLSDPDQDKCTRVTNAFLQMKKFKIRDLEKAFSGK